MSAHPRTDAVGLQVIGGTRWVPEEHAHKLEDELARAKADLETEQIRLAACGTIAMCDTRASAAEARQMHPDYRSGSCDDVARRVDECIRLREELARARDYAARLALGFQKRHYPEAKNFSPLEDVTGVLTQIDNMIGGLTGLNPSSGFPRLNPGDVIVVANPVFNSEGQLRELRQEARLDQLPDGRVIAELDYAQPDYRPRGVFRCPARHPLSPAPALTTFEATGDTWGIPGDRQVHGALLPADCLRTDLAKLVGQTVSLGGRAFRVTGVESRCVGQQRAGWPIGLAGHYEEPTDAQLEAAADPRNRPLTPLENWQQNDEHRQ